MEQNSSLEAIFKSGLRSIAASVPVAASIAQAWNEYENHTQIRRIEEAFTFLKEGLLCLEDRIEKVEKYILISGDVPSLFEKIFQKIKAEPSRKKRQNFIHLLIRSISVGYDLTYDFKVTFIEILDTLTEQDTNILLKFKSAKTLRGKDLIDKKVHNDEEFASETIISAPRYFEWVMV